MDYGAIPEMAAGIRQMLFALPESGMLFCQYWEGIL